MDELHPTERAAHLGLFQNSLPDVAILAVGLRDKVPDYACRLMRALGSPPVVFTNHFDAHRTPLDRSGMQLSEETRADLAKFADEIHACAPKTKVVVPVHFAEMVF